MMDREIKPRSRVPYIVGLAICGYLLALPVIEWLFFR